MVSVFVIFCLFFSKPVEKSEKPAVSQRSPGPVKTSAVNSPASSGEPDKKPVVKKEHVVSEGEKRASSRVSSTLLNSGAVASKKDGSKSPSTHAKSPLRAKEEKAE